MTITPEFRKRLEDHFADPDLCKRHQVGALERFCWYCAIEAIAEIRDIHAEHTSKSGIVCCNVCKKPYPCLTYRATLEGGIPGQRFGREDRTLLIDDGKFK